MNSLKVNFEKTNKKFTEGLDEMLNKIDGMGEKESFKSTTLVTKDQEAEDQEMKLAIAASLRE